MTSVGPDDNKTSTALQIANAASQENRKILLIDADVRMRHLSELFGFAQVGSEPNGHGPPGPGGEPVGAKEYVYRLVSTDSGMVLPVALEPTDPGHPGLLSRGGRRDAVRSIGEMFDLVLIDTPALASSTALGVAGQADGVVLVVSHGVALSHLRDVRDRLAFVETPLIGYIYVRPRSPGVRALWGRGPARPGAEELELERVAIGPEEELEREREHRHAGRRGPGGLQPQRPHPRLSALAARPAGARRNARCLRARRRQQRRHRRAIAEQFPEVTLLHGNGKLYWNGGMRRAFAAAIAGDYDYYLWMNDDTELDDGALAVLLDTERRLRERAMRR